MPRSSTSRMGLSRRTSANSCPANPGLDALSEATGNCRTGSPRRRPPDRPLDRAERGNAGSVSSHYRQRPRCDALQPPESGKETAWRDPGTMACPNRGANRFGFRR